VLTNVAAEVRGQFENPEERESPPLEAVTRGPVQQQQAEKTSIYALVNCKVCRTVKAESLLAVTFCKCSINTVINTNPVCNHSIML
jgi:hypothetical protein